MTAVGCTGKLRTFAAALPEPNLTNLRELLRFLGLPRDSTLSSPPLLLLLSHLSPR